ncbi:hypothetical protein Sarmat_00381 [Rickettsiales endosymbiont of Paramecium tredecaurelia]|uniref:hypothetical protein n=1 Tax=Candidatus Sarmatiella mevalonica TaxID=2770581 RepID=UPI001921F3D3|nr:hypothetical protein [Candidatus Sarmatiella mevalonica]MBL3284533.1 hypothetical protein [Candidatus Sarmatiella mevalonica]
MHAFFETHKWRLLFIALFAISFTPLVSFYIIILNPECTLEALKSLAQNPIAQHIASFSQELGVLSALGGFLERFALIFFIRKLCPKVMDAKFRHFQQKFIFQYASLFLSGVAMTMYQYSFFQSGIGLFAALYPIGIAAAIALLIAGFYFLLLTIDFARVMRAFFIK